MDYWRRIFLFLLVIQLSYQSELTQEDNWNKTQTDDLSVVQLIGHCVAEVEILKCLRQETVQAIESAINDNRTWYLNDYVQLNRNPDVEMRSNGLEQMNNNTTILDKISDLVQSRSLSFKFGPAIFEGIKKKRKKKGTLCNEGISSSI